MGPLLKLKTLLIILWIVIAGSRLKSQPLAIEWQVKAPGVWMATIGQPEALNLLKAAGNAPKAEAITAMGDTDFPLPEKAIYADLRDGKTYLRFPLQKEEELFGFGLNFKTVHQRGSILNLHVDHYTGKDNGRTHAPVPFYVSDRGYGVFINAARYIKVYAGTAARKDSEHPPVVRDRNTDPAWTSMPYSDAVEIVVPAEGVEVYIFGGPTPMSAVRRFNLWNGGGFLPPKWGLGFTHRTPTLYSAEQVREEVEAFEEHNFPLDFIGLEPGWQSKAYPCTFDWDKGRFPNPEQFTQEMLRKNIRLNLWLNPYVSPESSIYTKLKPYTGTHTVWAGLVPDVSMPEVRNIFKEHFRKTHVSMGIGGYKIDEVDGYDKWLWPDHARFPSGLSGEQMRQTYGLYMQRLITDIYREQNCRTFGLVRASNAGGTPFPYVIYNDYYSHQDFITALINSSFSGLLWTPEVRASASGEEWLRRMQSVCFSPMAMLNAWADGTKPWSFPEVEEAVRDVAFMRMQLLPYLYTTFAQYYFEGTPPFRAMHLVKGFHDEVSEKKGNLNSTNNPYQIAKKQEVKDQYMAGDFLLIAPMFTGQQSRQVILPEGKWYDFYTGEYAGEGEIITVSPGLYKIPVFVKNGGIIPMMPPRRQTPAKGEKVPLIIRHYGASAASYELYDDDGQTFDYESGEYTWTLMKAEKDKKGKWKGSVVKPSGDKPFYYTDIQWQFMTPTNGN